MEPRPDPPPWLPVARTPPPPTPRAASVLHLAAAHPYAPRCRGPGHRVGGAAAVAVRGVVGDPVAGRARACCSCSGCCAWTGCCAAGCGTSAASSCVVGLMYSTGPVGVGAGREHRRARRGAAAAAVVAAGRRRGGDVRGLRRRLRDLDLPDQQEAAARAGRGGERAELRAAGGSAPPSGWSARCWRTSRRTTCPRSAGCSTCLRGPTSCGSPAPRTAPARSPPCAAARAAPSTSTSTPRPPRTAPCG